MESVKKDIEKTEKQIKEINDEINKKKGSECKCEKKGDCIKKLLYKLKKLNELLLFLSNN